LDNDDEPHFIKIDLKMDETCTMPVDSFKGDLAKIVLLENEFNQQKNNYMQDKEIGLQ
jgi:CYTH domain-containing protein